MNGLCSFASTSGDHSVVSGILDKGGHDESFVGPISFIGAVEGVPDIYAVIERVVGVVGDESWGRVRGLVFFIGLFCYVMVGTFTRRGLSCTLGY